MKKLIITLMAAALAIAANAQTDTLSKEDQIYSKVMSAYAAGDWKEVAILCEDVVYSDEELDDLELVYCEALNHTGRALMAIDRLENYVKKHPNDYQAYCVLAEISQGAGLNGKAIENFEKSAKAQPGFARPLVALARIYSSSYPGLAMENYNKAIRIFLLNNRPDAAIQLGTEAIKVNPSDVTMLMLMGDALKQANMPDKAMVFFAEVINLENNAADPDLEAIVDANYNLAHIYYTSGDYKKSMSMLQNIIDSTAAMNAKADDLALVMCLAASNQAKLGNNQGRDKYLEMASKYQPDGYKQTYENLLNQ